VGAAEDAAGVGGAAVDVVEGAAGVGDAAGVVAIVVGAEVAEADAEETLSMRSKMAFICCNMFVHLDIDADISDSDAAMANSIWGKILGFPN